MTPISCCLLLHVSRMCSCLDASVVGDTGHVIPTPMQQAMQTTKGPCLSYLLLGCCRAICSPAIAAGLVSSSRQHL